MPYSTTYRNEDIFLPALARENGIIRDTHFDVCVIRGPAIIVLQPDCVMDTGEIIHPLEQDLNLPIESYVWVRGIDEPLIGCIGLFNCRFDQCQFDGIGWAGTESFRESMRQAVTFGRWEDELRG